VPTVPGKGWFVVLRLYGPLNAWFDKKWKPGEVGGDEVTCGWDEAGSHDRSAAISLIRFF
jgi:hypothetical protein